MSWQKALVAVFALAPAPLLLMGAVMAGSESSQPPPPPAAANQRLSGMQAVVFGATGAVGQALVHELVASEAAAAVRTVGRREFAFADAGSPKLQQTVLDMAPLGAEALDEADAAVAEVRGLLSADTTVFICLGSRVKHGERAFRAVDYWSVKNIAALAQAAGVRHVSLVSTMGADPGAALLYSRTKGEADEELRRAGLPRASVFRPSLLITEREEARTGEGVAQAVMPHVDWVLQGGLKKYRSIAVETVARAMLENALRPSEAAYEMYESDVVAALGS